MAKSPDAVVIDASVATKWYLTDEEEADKSLILLKRFADGLVEFIAPDHIRYEIPSAITVATLGHPPRVSRAMGRLAIGEFLALGVQTIYDGELILEAYSLVHKHTIALYDALYLALAERLKISFITADHKLYKKIHQLPYVIWIGKYTSQ